MLIVFWGDWSMMHALRLHWFWGFLRKSQESTTVRGGEFSVPISTRLLFHSPGWCRYYCCKHDKVVRPDLKKKTTEAAHLGPG